MINNPNDRPIGERRSGEDRRKTKNPRRKEHRVEMGKPPRRTSKDRRKTT